MGKAKEEIISHFDDLLRKLQIDHEKITHNEMKALSNSSVYYLCKIENVEIYDSIIFTIRISTEHRTIYFACQRIYKVQDDVEEVYKAINEINQCALSGALYVLDGYVQYRSVLFYPPTSTKVSSDIVDMYIEHIIDAIYLFNQELDAQKDE